MILLLGLFLKDFDGDGLIEHGFTGIAEKMPIQDSTWMDHIDRRKSANDIQALFYESLSIGSELAGIVGDDDNRRKWLDSSRSLQIRIDSEYWNAQKAFYYDTIRRDGSKDPSIASWSRYSDFRHSGLEPAAKVSSTTYNSLGKADSKPWGDRV